MTGNRADVTGAAVGKTGSGIGWPIEIVGTTIGLTPISGISGTYQNGDLMPFGTAGPVDLGSSGKT